MNAVIDNASEKIMEQNQDMTHETTENQDISDIDIEPAKSIPRKIKFMISVVVVFLLTSIGFMVMSNSNMKELEAASLVEEKEMMLSEIESQDLKLQNHIEGFEKRVVDVEAYSKKISTNTSQITSLEGKMGLIEAQIKKLTEVTGILQAFKKSTIAKTRPAKVVRSKKKPTGKVFNRLPFRLVSIDSWAGQKYITISKDGVLETITIGDKYHGWMLSSLRDDQATFINGRSAKVIKEDISSLL